MLLALAVAWSLWQLLQIRFAWHRGRAALAGSAKSPAQALPPDGPPAEAPPAQAPPADVAIVLGRRTRGPEPSPAFMERLDVAARLYQEGRARHILLTGGVDTGHRISEAEAAARYLTQRYAIPAAALTLERHSTTTNGNLRGARAILAERGWQSVLLVTHGFHLHRSLKLARTHSISAVGIAVESEMLFLPYHVAREVAALTWYAVPGLKWP